MIKYSNYIISLFFAIYTIYNLSAYVSFKFNCLYNLRAKLMNYNINKYGIASNKEDALKFRLRKYYFSMSILSFLLLVSPRIYSLLDFKIDWFVVLIISIKYWNLRKYLENLK